MSKPIFVVRLPKDYDQECCKNIGITLNNRFNDWHVLVVSCNVFDVSFECYHVTDLDTKSFEELKEIVLNLKNQN